MLDASRNRDGWGDLLSAPQVVGVVECDPELPDWKAHEPCWTARDAEGELFLVSRPGVRGVEDWTLRAVDAAGSIHVLAPAPEADLVAPELCEQGCWRIGSEPPAALDLHTPHGSRRLMGSGEVGTFPLPECCDAEAVPDVAFASDLEEVLHMFAPRAHVCGWGVEVTDPDGWTHEARVVRRFVGHRLVREEEVCWDVQRALFGTVHLRLPERPGVRVLVRDGRQLPR